MLTLKGMRVQSLVAELRSCMPCREAKTLKKKFFFVRENVKKQTKNKTKNTLGNRYHHTNLFDNPHLMRGCMV